jgi:hypothetical protein
MKMPFGKHRGRELEQLPDSYLRWIDEKLELNPPATTAPENRERYFKLNQQLKLDARRILRDRRLNGVKVKDPVDNAAESRARAGSGRRGWRM